MVGSKCGNRKLGKHRHKMNRTSFFGSSLEVFTCPYTHFFNTFVYFWTVAVVGEKNKNTSLTAHHDINVQPLIL